MHMEARAHIGRPSGPLQTTHTTKPIGKKAMEGDGERNSLSEDWIDQIMANPVASPHHLQDRPPLALADNGEEITL